MAEKRRSRFGQIRKLGSGRYQARYFRDGQWHNGPRTYRLRVEAQDWLDDQSTDRRRGEWIDPTKGKMTFAEWAKRWEDNLVGLRASTEARDVGYLHRYCLSAFGNKKLNEIDHELLTGWVSDLDKRLAPATTAKALQVCSKVMRSAVMAGRIPADPTTTVKAPRVERAEARYLDPSEIKALGDAMDSAYCSLVYVLAYGGLRVSEAFGLRWKSVDLQTGRITISEGLVEVEGYLVASPLKTKAARRSLTLPSVAQIELQKGLRDTEYVWTGPAGGAVRLNNFRKRYWAPAVKAAGLDHLTPHSLRHTCASLLIKAGRSPLEVSRYLGHSSPAFTLSTYAHLYDGWGVEVADSLDRLAEGYDTDMTRV
jgi:integrase